MVITVASSALVVVVVAVEAPTTVRNIKQINEGYV